jgi:protein-S-isoprenylcysteine O-methyltransferase Ste14
MGSLFVAATARVEERECARKFGAAYDDYRSRTKMFVPFVV